MRWRRRAHLLLLRSFEEIAARRPALDRPAITAREMAASADLPEKAKGTFALIAGQVEASLFGGRALGASGWAACRAAYAQFAAPGWA